MTTNPGYKLEHCRKGCIRSTQDWSELHDQLEQVLEKLDLSTHLAKHFNPVLYHHLPKIALSGCPNGCSHPQIKDIGITGYMVPKMTEKVCSGCLACIDSCLENALIWNNQEVQYDKDLCINCGDCVRNCPTGKIEAVESGWTFHLGGRLGRHPQLAKIAGKVNNNSKVIATIENILKDYLNQALPQERLNRFLDRKNSQEFIQD